LTIQNVTCLLAKPKEQSNLAGLRKQSEQLKKITGLNCVLCLEGIRIYTKEKMLAEGIPFVIAGTQIYMPFLGVALSKADEREIPNIESISFSTQRLLLTAIYEGWKQTTLIYSLPEIDSKKCIICGKCMKFCPKSAFEKVQVD